jgi:hypothetical protein
MPDTLKWLQLVDAAHDWDEEPPAEAVAALDTTMQEFADVLGLTLDRHTLEGAVWTFAAIASIACLFEESQRPDGDGVPSHENTALAVQTARYLVVKRLDALGATDA